MLDLYSTIVEMSGRGKTAATGCCSRGRPGIALSDPWSTSTHSHVRTSSHTHTNMQGARTKALEEVLRAGPEFLEAVAVDEELGGRLVHVALESSRHLGLYVGNSLHCATRVLELQEELPDLPCRLRGPLQGRENGVEGHPRVLLLVEVPVTREHKRGREFTCKRGKGIERGENLSVVERQCESESGKSERDIARGERERGKRGGETVRVML